MFGLELLSGMVPVVIILVFVIGSSLRILREYERGIIFRLGKLARAIFNPHRPWPPDPHPPRG